MGESTININPDGREFLVSEPKNTLREVENKLRDADEAKKFAAASFEGGIMLLGRGIVDNKDVEELLNVAIAGKEDVFNSPYEIPSYRKLQPKESDEANRALLAKFKEAMLDPQNREKFIQTLRAELQVATKEGREHAREYFEKASSLLRSWGVQIGAPEPNGKISLLTPEEIKYLKANSALGVAFDGDEISGCVIDDDSRTEYGTVVSKLNVSVKQDEETGFYMAFSPAKGIIEHEMTHYLAQQLHNTKVYTPAESSGVATVIFKGFFPNVYNLDGSRNWKEEAKIRLGRNVPGSNGYNLFNLNEGSTALFHAIVNCSGDINAAEQLLDANRFGTFETYEYTKWALNLIPVVRKVGLANFAKAYFEGDFEGFVKNLAEKGMNLPSVMESLDEKIT